MYALCSRMKDMPQSDIQEKAKNKKKPLKDAPQQIGMRKLGGESTTVIVLTTGQRGRE